jgi:hypothetical protein
MRWSVAIEAEGDRVLTREEIVELADAVAMSSGIASGIGTMRYGAQLIVEAETPEQAGERATAEFIAAATRAGLPTWPIVRLDAMSEDEDMADLEEIDEVP